MIRILTGAQYYQVAISQFTQNLHPSLPDPTTLWGYRDATQAANTQTHIGGMIVTTRNKPVRIRFTNELPATHILPVDTTIPGCETRPAENRTAVHIHGGVVPWTSDGGPFDWWTPLNDGTAATIGERGSSFLNGPGGFLDTFTGLQYYGTRPGRLPLPQRHEQPAACGTTTMPWASPG